MQEIQAVLLGEEASIEASDPYFTIEIDVYLSGTMPDLGMRRSLVPQATAFQTSTIGTVDRFLVEELPVSVHYVRAEAVDRMLLRINEKDWVFHEPGTNVLYRLERGEVLFGRNGWIEETRAALAHAPGEFWWQARLRSFALAERALADLGAASHRSDDLFFVISAARLVRAVVSFVFAANRQFEPSERMISERIASLPVLPDELLGRLDNLLRPTVEIPLSIRREIGEHIVKSLMPLTIQEND
jgi:hypothetical protein